MMNKLFIYFRIAILTLLLSSSSFATSFAKVPALNFDNMQSGSVKEDATTPLNTERIMDRVLDTGEDGLPAHYNFERNKVLLSLDGGGIKGYIEALMLLAFENLASKTIGQPIKIGQMVHMFAGTSTGGIAALALTRRSDTDPTIPKYGAQDLVDLYEKDGPSIFEQSWWQWLTSCNGLLTEKYSDHNLDKLLKEKFGDSKVCDAVTNVVVTAYELKDIGKGSEPVLFTSYQLGNQLPSEVLARQAAAASGAAPTYFPSETIDIKNPEGVVETRTFIDGGMTGMNNPDACLFIQATSLVNQEERKANTPQYLRTVDADYLHVSLGAGECPMYYNSHSFLNRSLLSILKDIINISLDAPKASTVAMLNTYCAMTLNNNYLRLSPEIGQPVELDDTSASTFKLMKEKTLAFIKDRIEDFKMIADRMVCAVLAKNPNLNRALYNEKKREYERDNLVVLARRKIELAAENKLNDQNIADSNKACSEETKFNVMERLDMKITSERLAQNRPAVVALNDYNLRQSSNEEPAVNVVIPLASSSLDTSAKVQEEFKSRIQNVKNAPEQIIKNKASNTLISTISNPNLPLANINFANIKHVPGFANVNSPRGIMSKHTKNDSHYNIDMINSPRNTGSPRSVSFQDNQNFEPPLLNRHHTRGDNARCASKLSVNASIDLRAASAYHDNTNQIDEDMKFINIRSSKTDSDIYINGNQSPVTTRSVLRSDSKESSLSLTM